MFLAFEGSQKRDECLCFCGLLGVLSQFWGGGAEWDTMDVYRQTLLVLFPPPSSKLVWGALHHKSLQCPQGRKVSQGN